MLPTIANASLSPGTELPSLDILLVEDHGPTRKALTNLLSRRNHRVKAASCVTEARRIAASQTFQLLISDIGLPDGSGCELMNEFRRQFKMQGIALTGYGMENDVKQGHDAGFAIYLIKPVRAQLLDHALARLFGQP